MLGTLLILQLIVVSQLSSTEASSECITTTLLQSVVHNLTVEMKNLKRAVQDLQTTNSRAIARVQSDVTNLEKKANCRAPHWVTPAGALGTVEEKQQFTVTVKATDPDKKGITYSLQSGVLPETFKLNASTGSIKGTAPMTTGADDIYTFAIRATGPQCSYADRDFAITVTDIPYMSGQQVFTPSGTSSQTFTVPPGVPSSDYPLTIRAWGAGGGRGTDGPEGGGGGFTKVLLTSGVSSGNILIITVGHRGRNGNGNRCGGGGGGSTSIRRGSDSVALAIAGGGGGGVAVSSGRLDAGGGGGGQTGQQGLEDRYSGKEGGSGGTQSSPGEGGDSSRGYSPGQNGSGRNGGDGGSRTGHGGGGAGGWGDGNGGSGGCVSGDGGGGGGGGGYFGGGGGGGGAWGSSGGGGSGYYDTTFGTGVTLIANRQNTPGRGEVGYSDNYGQAQNDGYVIISW